MGKKKIAVVIPPFNPVGDYYDIPVNYACVFSALDVAGYDYTVINLNEEVYNRCEVSETDAVCMAVVDMVKGADIVITGGLSVYYPAMRIIRDCLKADQKVLLGGGLVTAQPQMIMRALEADYAVLGECEYSLPELLEWIEGDQCGLPPPGTVVSSHNSFVFGDKRPPIKDLDATPDPNLDALGAEAYIDSLLTNDRYHHYYEDHPRLLPIFSSRSCPYDCAFCWHPTGRIYRQRRLKPFFEYVRRFVDQYRLSSLAILDEMLASKKERFFEFCKQMKEVGVKWVTQMRSPDATEEVLVAMKEAGCYYVSLGVESMNDESLKHMKKCTTKSDNEKAIELCYKHDLGVQANIILGFPWETFETLSESLNWVLENQKHWIHTIMLGVHPNAPLFNWAVKNGRINALEHIEGGCRETTFTELNPVHHNVLMEKLKIIQHTRPVGRLKQENVYAHSKRRLRALAEIVIDCPHCRRENTYRNFGIERCYQHPHIDGHHQHFIVCKTCNQSFGANLNLATP